ncbi:MAG: ABC transporter permease [Candidatus Coatesbacteria bacterium]|nr:ABC transporter permease [Candidatus Coatesbacteria bacterium]
MHKLPFFVAFRYLFSKKRIKFTSLTSIIAILGIVFGVFALINVISVLNGLQKDLRNRLLMTTPSIRIQYSKHKPIKNPDKVISRIEKNNNIKKIRKSYASKALLSSGKFASGALVVGYDEKEIMNRYSNFVETGEIDLNPIEIGNEVYYPLVLGTFLADRLHAVIGQKISISNISELVPGNDNLFPKQVDFILVATLKSGLPSYDNASAFTNLDGIRYWLSEDISTITDIEIDLHDVYKAPAISSEFKSLIKDDKIEIHNWIEDNKHLFSSLKYEKIVTFMILGLIIIIAAFNIISTVLLFITEKKIGIAMLVTFGLPVKEIRLIFILLGIFIGMIGIILGSIMGLISIYFLSTYPLPIHGKLFPFQTVPVHFEIIDIVLIISGAFILSTLVTLIPSARLKYFEPLDVIYNRR